MQKYQRHRKEVEFYCGSLFCRNNRWADCSSASFWARRHFEVCHVKFIPADCVSVKHQYKHTCQCIVVVLEGYSKIDHRIYKMHWIFFMLPNTRKMELIWGLGQQRLPSSVTWLKSLSTKSCTTVTWWFKRWSQMHKTVACHLRAVRKESLWHSRRS